MGRPAPWSYRFLMASLPWSPRSWGRAILMTGGIPAQAVALLIVMAPTAVKAKPKTAAVSILLLILVLLTVPLFTRLQRYRLRCTAETDIPPQQDIPNSLLLDRRIAVARFRRYLRQLAYHLVVGPLVAATAVVGFGFWLAGTVYTTVFLWSWALATPGGTFYVGSSGKFVEDVIVTGGGVALLFAAPWVTSGVTALDVRVTRALLGPSRSEELQDRVRELTQTRAGVVDAADAERRRLERDLHDGTQQRLVSLAMNLGMARVQAVSTEDAREAIAEAHEEAKAALSELRDLIRGLHPAVLEDRGLDAALSGIAARMPVPVRLTVDLPRRPAPVIEAVAYFVVSEGLSNIVKHAQASQAEVFVQRASDRLHIIVSDDGIGGADPTRGTGLAGLAKRASSVDGTFEVSSPIGGPTLLSVDLPCAR
jgi:signal transduction histidine kinase